MMRGLLLSGLLSGLAVAGCLADGNAGLDLPAPGVAAPLGPFPPDTSIGTTRIFTPVGEPGFPEGIALDGNRLYVGSAQRQGAGVVFIHDVITGMLSGTVSLEAPDEQRGPFVEGALGLAIDAQGRLYAAQVSGARILRADPGVDVMREVYAEIPDLPSCAAAPAPCSPTATDRRPLPNYLAFAPDGALYVSDTFQATIFRIPSGGGVAQPWFQDPRLDGFGPNGIAVSPDERFLYVAQTVFAYAEAPVEGAPLAAVPTGGIYRIPLTKAPDADDLELFHGSTRGAVDGLAFAASGRLYAAIIDLSLGSVHGSGDGISVLDADGAEQRFFPSDESPRQEAPFDGPASVVFHDAHRSLLVTNLANSPPAPDHWAVLEAFVDDTGLPLHRPEVA